MTLESRSSQAEDISVVPAGAPRASTVRTTTKKPSPRPSPRPLPRPAAAVAAPRRTVPRPIVDESTAAAITPVSASVPAQAPASAPAPAVMPAPAGARARRGQEEAVNLDALPAPRAAPVSTAAKAPVSYSPHGAPAGGVLPNFKFYFDFLLRSWKGKQNPGGTGGVSAFSFDSYHQRLLAEYTPTPELMFQADLLQQQYFESDYMLTPRLQVRWGRIWIPFDDMSPHSMFGGRINTSEFRQANETAFLPNIWADLGVGFKYTLADSSSYSSDLHFYVVNGFQENRGGSPVDGEGNASASGQPGSKAAYPTFDGTTGGTGDNNNDKAFGARWHSILGRRFGFGISIYHDVYTDTGQDSRGILILGLDIQLRPTATTEIRMGYASMKVDLDPVASTKASFSRTGTYIELGQRFGLEERWKFLVRAGSSQNDNRVVDVSDKTIVGGTLLKNFGSIETQFNFFHDLHQVASKIAYNYGELRVVTAF